MIRFYIAALVLLVLSCKKDIVRNVYVITDSVIITDSIYSINGQLVDLGTGVSDYGHCWSTNPNPTIADFKTQFGSTNNLQQFSSTLNNLTDGNTYYIRSYAESNNEVFYSNEIWFSTNRPDVKVNGVFQKNLDSILVTGYVDFKVDTATYEYGFCWTVDNTIPTISDELNYIGETNRNINFASFIINVEDGTTYKVRAYIRNAHSVYYSDLTTITGGNLIFYNSFDTKGDLTSNDLYPSIYQQSYNASDWGRAYLTKAVYNNGLYINHEMDEGWGPVNSANFFAIDTREIKLSIEMGCIEFWFVFDFDDDTANTSFFFYMANELNNHFVNGQNQDNTFLYAGWNGWSQDFTEVQSGFFFKISDPESGQKKSIETNLNENSQTNRLHFAKGTTLHFRFVWNLHGIYNTDETMQIYINDVKLAKGQHKWNINGGIENYLYLGTIPGFGSRSHYYNAVKGMLDELRIYNFSNTGNFNEL
jgi:hypothetical protein